MSTRELALGSGATVSKFFLTDTDLVVERAADKKWPKLKTSLRNVLWAGVDKDVFEVSLLAKKKSKSPFVLIHVTGTVAEADKEPATAFAEAVMAAAYSGLKRERRLKVFVNPHSGPGKAVAQYRKKIEPIFHAAKCKVDVTFTTKRNHAKEVVEKLPLDQFDAIVVMSGDGLIHEVLNGYAAHAEPARALRTPISPIPTGSGNGLCINLIGIEESKDISVAAINAIKGKPMDVDLFSMIQGGKRYLSFMSQSMGMMATLDLGTEHLRFMGGQRFVVGFIQEVFKNKACSINVSIKVATADKQKMFEDMQSSRAHAKETHGSASPAAAEELTSTALPELKHIGPDASKDDWITFDKPFTYLYAGKGPYVSADFVQFPVSLPTDGFIDIVLQERSHRGAMLKAMDGAERGAPFWLDMQHVYKAYAYRIEPQSPKGYLSVDGEAFRLESFELEVHQGLGCFLSMYGYYQVDFDAPKKAQ